MGHPIQNSYCVVGSDSDRPQFRVNPKYTVGPKLKASPCVTYVLNLILISVGESVWFLDLFLGWLRVVSSC